MPDNGKVWDSHPLDLRCIFEDGKFVATCIEINSIIRLVRFAADQVRLNGNDEAADYIRNMIDRTAHIAEQSTARAMATNARNMAS